MRVIKFRAWDIQSKWMIYLTNMKMLGEYSCLSFYEVSSHYGVDEDKNYEIMQFTGLHDKNGKEIWEGDIIQTNNQKYMPYGIFSVPVRWFNKIAQWSIYSGDSRLYDMEWEVIGNIYENPELLKETK